MFHRSKDIAQAEAEKIASEDDRLRYVKVELEPDKGWVVVVCPKPYKLDQYKWEKIPTRAKADELIAELLCDRRVQTADKEFMADKGWAVTAVPSEVDVDDLLDRFEVRHPITGKSRRRF